MRFRWMCGALVTVAGSVFAQATPHIIHLPEPARIRASHLQKRAAPQHGIVYGTPRSPKIPGGSAADAARNFLQAYAASYGLTAADIANIAATERPGIVSAARDITITQTVAGRPLYGAKLHLHLGPSGELIAAAGDLYGDLRWAGNAKLTPDDAHANSSRVIDRIAPPLGTGPVRGARFDQATTTEVAYPVGTESRPAFLTTGIVSGNGMDGFDVVVDAISGEILEVIQRTWYSQGQVFQNVSGQPQSPQPSATSGFAPPTPNPPVYVSRVTIPFSSFLTGTTLSGNLANVREYQAWTGQNRTATSGNAISSGTADFSFPLNIGAGQPDVRNYPQATGANLFYLLNYLHDYFYGLGFDEVHGNFQVDNGGHGGLGGDPVIGFVQQGSGLPGQSEYAANNANMFTPDDGQSPLMAMFVFDGTGIAPSRSFLADSALDPDVVFHEFTHGVTERLTPGPVAGTGQPGGMNEGNSDFFALNIQIPSSAPVDGAFPVGGYSVQDFTNGIRHYPYSTNTSVNPLTYANFGTIDGYSEVHNDGEIWTSAMWQLRGQLINALGYSTGRQRSAQLDIDALQMLPTALTYIDFRNAILTADATRYAGADSAQIWSAFATRGLGALADGGIDGYSIHVLSDTSTPSTAAHVRLYDSAFIQGETIRVLVSDSNAASSSVTLTTTSGDHETIALTADGPTWKGSVPSAAGAVTMNDGTLELTAGDTVIATITDANTGGAIPALTATAAVHAPYTISTTANAFNAALSPNLLFRGDEQTSSVDLAFTFPFYGQNYSRVYINDNGQIAFASAPFIRQRGTGSVGSPPTIAPFSVDLNCTGGSGIFYYSAADRFTARWSCVEYAAPSNAANFSVSIFPTGAIQFDYGSGNGLSGSDYYTNLADIATVGLSRGTDTFSQAVPNYDGSKSLNNAATVLFTPVADQTIATCPSAFTDPTLIAGTTTIKAVHFTEVRTCINAMRTLANLAQVTFTPSNLTAATVTAATIMEMRNALAPALSVLGRSATYARNPITTGMTILASDLQELRNASK